jgi:hypothetical protein
VYICSYYQNRHCPIEDLGQGGSDFATTCSFQEGGRDDSQTLLPSKSASNKGVV